MAKKKRTSARRIYVKAKKRYRKSPALQLTALATGALLYGASRGHLSARLAPYTAMIPAGNISDEVGMAALAYIAHKKIKNKTVQNVAKAALTIEIARIGDAIATGQLNLGTGSAATATASSGARIF